MNTSRHSIENTSFHGIHVGYRAPQKARFQLLTPEAEREIREGRLPDLELLCLELYRTFTLPEASFNAMQFVPVLQRLGFLHSEEKDLILQHDQTKHVLVQNNLIKIVLIHWKPGEFSNIHGHPSGGCVFKVLHGSIIEHRYTPNSTQQLLSTSSIHDMGMGYIDDTLAYHSVGNAGSKSAISLHVYTPGKKENA